MEITGKCFQCGQDCTDLDLVADEYLCTDCYNKMWDKYLEEQKRKDHSVIVASVDTPSS